MSRFDKGTLADVFEKEERVEYGIFADEGLLEAEFFSRGEAEAALEESYAEDAAHVGEVCHDHPGHERETCEPCARGKAS